MAVMTYFPIIGMGVSLAIAGTSGYIDLRLTDNDLVTQISDMEDDISGIDTNEEAIEEIQRLLIQRQGRIDLDVQRLQNDIEKQDIKLDQLLDILTEIKTNTE